MLLQINTSKELNKKLKIYKAVNDLSSLEEAVILILEDKLNNKIIREVK